MDLFEEWLQTPNGRVSSERLPAGQDVLKSRLRLAFTAGFQAAVTMKPTPQDAAKKA